MPKVTVTRPEPGAAILATTSYASSLAFMVSGQVTGDTSSDGQEFPVTRISTKIDDGDEIFIFGLNPSFSYSYFVWRSIVDPGPHVLHVTAYVDDIPNQIRSHTVDVPIVCVGSQKQPDSPWNMLAALYDRNAREMDFVAFDTNGGVILDHTNPFLGFNVWDLIVAGNFIGFAGVPASALISTQLMLYDRQAGLGGVIGFDASGWISLDSIAGGWRTTWDLAVAGDFIGNGKSQVLLYDRQAGQADIVGFDGNGDINLDHTNSGWRTTWDLAVAGDFIGNGKSQVLLYDRQAGQADIVGFDENGATNLDHTNSGWRTSWDIIVALNIGYFGVGSLVLLYDRQAGQADIVGFDANGATNLDHTNSGWRTSWDLVLPWALNLNQAVLYDRNAGVADFVQFDKYGVTNLDQSNTGWRTSWDLAAVGGGGRNMLLLYDRQAGQADIVGFDANGVTNLDHTNSGWRTSWDAIVLLS
jgi:hypothetical protein